ncbi:hypothetical protein [Ensifer sp. SSB1]|uniref:hypothetical protein n=1 Tax=Ensifer sp. SSB1 TaxID=2795385 RepID=UPI001A5B5834|nr:hypothetical protein [Ensifer sp. SSB1]MBK5571440.1 hypothetical protein [Ensifer sp. SSB1]
MLNTPSYLHWIAALAEDVTAAAASAFRSEITPSSTIERGGKDIARGVLSGTISADKIRPTQE